MPAPTRQTAARQAVLATLQDSASHLSAAAIFARVQRDLPKVGLATIYRALKFLLQKNLILKHAFDAAEARYELQRASHHHDHLLCEKCGQIVEFEDAVIEAQQTKIAATYGFRLTRHRHELFGVCPRCQTN